MAFVNLNKCTTLNFSPIVFLSLCISLSQCHCILIRLHEKEKKRKRERKEGSKQRFALKAFCFNEMMKKVVPLKCNVRMGVPPGPVVNVLNMSWRKPGSSKNMMPGPSNQTNCTIQAKICSKIDQFLTKWPTLALLVDLGLIHTCSSCLQIPQWTESVQRYEFFYLGCTTQPSTAESALM